jgi:hypothetical protein
MPAASGAARRSVNCDWRSGWGDVDKADGVSALACSGTDTRPAPAGLVAELYFERMPVCPSLGHPGQYAREVHNMPDRGAAGTAIAAMAMHEVLIRVLIGRGVLSAGEMRAIIDNILLQLEETYHELARGAERDVFASQMMALKNLLEKLSEA